MRFRGAVFDLDGTLGDTLPVCFASFRRLFHRRLGVTLNNREIRARFGPSEEGLIRGLIPGDADNAIEEYFAYYRRDHARCRRPFAGIPELLAGLRDADVRLAVVTGKGARSAAISLDEMGLADFFEFVEAGSETGGIKPACMRRVIETWGFDPAEVLSVGDAPADVRSAREVGLVSLAAAWAPGTERAELEAESPDYLFDRVITADWVLDSSPSV